ncbi:hypothetical protein [Janthinobacterium sp. 17J80-10]|uniref:hypothetical protein n=1 Tax=Janthinobacterium sp. 17J80-10 TaxID=2497863 RepID=UPI0010055254|nr:hypothetical protein [Janthinobacterium sp. 17J80-10]QAU32894.1 hypothetical protein EKL02_01180 [Janthinobacterium sp. 17J80-10]
MRAAPNYKKKVISLFVRAITQEENELRKWSRNTKLCNFVGVLLIFAAILESIEPHWPIWGITLIGIVGGFSLGLGILFSTSVLQWPIIRPFLKEDQILNANDEAHP